jgi:hypothetical protein
MPSPYGPGAAFWSIRLTQMVLDLVNTRLRGLDFRLDFDLGGF